MGMLVSRLSSLVHTFFFFLFSLPPVLTHTPSPTSSLSHTLTHSHIFSHTLTHTHTLSHTLNQKKFSPSVLVFPSSSRKTTNTNTNKDSHVFQEISTLQEESLRKWLSQMGFNVPVTDARSSSSSSRSSSDSTVTSDPLRNGTLLCAVVQMLDPGTFLIVFFTTKIWAHKISILSLHLSLCHGLFFFILFFSFF